MRLGIDFGTTRTVVAYGDRGNYPLVSFLDAAGDAHEWFPSLAAHAARGDRWCFGFEAARAAAADPAAWTLHRSFKRLLTDPDAADREAALALCTAYLRALREAILERSNVARAFASAGEPLEAVIAAPANAHGTQRFLTMEAFRRAGFDVVAMLNEPSAAGFEYTHRYRNTLSSRRDAIVVYDLGGGTFDVSLIRASGRHHEVAATFGINRLGGDDFDDVLARLALAQVGRDGRSLPPGAWTRVLDRCREAKEALTPHTRRLSIDLDAVDAGEITVAVGDYYAACAPLVEQTILGMSPVLRSADEEGEESDAERAARVEGAADLSEVAGIYVVGGASALPLVGRALRERFGRRVHRSPYPFAATALGLAIAADAASGFTLRDMLSRHFGVFRENENGHVISFDPIFTREVSLPAPGAPPFTLRRVYRAAHNVGHYRFAECSSVDDRGIPSGELTPLGDVRFAFDPALREEALDHVPVERRTGGPLVQEEYAVDGSGIVCVTISDLENGYARQFRLGG
jgi:molecular chaperone DnaK (HSP70)